MHYSCEGRSRMASLIQRSNRPTYYIQYRVGGKLKRECTHTEVLQVAKQKLRDFENAWASGEESSLPTRTAIGDSTDTADWASKRTGEFERFEYFDTETKDGTNTGEHYAKTLSQITIFTT